MIISGEDKSQSSTAQPIQANVTNHAVLMTKCKLSEDKKEIKFELKNSTELGNTSKGEHLEGTIDLKKPHLPIILKNSGQVNSQILWKMTNFDTFSVGFE